MGLRELKKERTRQELLDVARALFLKRGFDATRVRDIAHRLQVSEQTVFNYFPSKQALVEALAQDWFAANAQPAASAPPPATGPVLPYGRERLAASLRSFEPHRDLLRLFLDHSSLGLLQATGRAPRPDDSPMLQAARAQRRNSAAFYRLAQERGELRPDVNTDELAEMVGVILGTCLRTWVDTEPVPDLVELVFRRVGLLVDGARIGAPLDVRRAVAAAVPR